MELLHDGRPVFDMLAMPAMPLEESLSSHIRELPDPDPY